MTTPLAPTPTDKNTCATCYHSTKSRPKPCPGCDTPRSIYKCTLTDRKVNPNQTPCSLYKSLPLPIYPLPTCPISHPLVT